MTEAQTPAEYWEGMYSDAERVWSGRVNHVLSEVAPAFMPGRALDLGCGEGGDVIWLAARGWHVTGLDVSPTAIARARSAAEEAGLGAHTQFEVADLEEWTSSSDYDLITASFLQSMSVPLQREAVLRRAATRVAKGGHMLIVSHAAPPSWADPEHHHWHDFPSPEGDVASLGLDLRQWEVRICETRDRAATSPDGDPATLTDSVVLVRRVSAA